MSISVGMELKNHLENLKTYSQNGRDLCSQSQRHSCEHCLMNNLVIYVFFSRQGRKYAIIYDTLIEMLFFLFVGFGVLFFFVLKYFYSMLLVDTAISNGKV